MNTMPYLRCSIGPLSIHDMTQSAVGFLNGYRAPLIVNGVTLIPLVIVLVNMYADVQQLKGDRLERVSGERMAKLEATVQQGTDQRYRAGDAQRDFAYRDAEITRLREEIRILQDRLDRMDRK